MSPSQRFSNGSTAVFHVVKGLRAFRNIFMLSLWGIPSERNPEGKVLEKAQAKVPGLTILSGNCILNLIALPTLINVPIFHFNDIKCHPLRSVIVLQKYLQVMFC